MAKSKTSPIEIKCPLEVLAVEARALTKLDLLYDFCEQNNIPYRDDEYDIEPLTLQCFGEVVAETYGDILSDAAEATLNRKGFLLSDGKKVYGMDMARMFAYDIEPLMENGSESITHVLIKIHDPDMAMLVKLSLP
jgi:hypothetical protein